MARGKTTSAFTKGQVNTYSETLSCYLAINYVGVQIFLSTTVYIYMYVLLFLWICAIY